MEDKENPIPLRYEGLEILEAGDRVLYNLHSDANFTPAEVIRAGITGAYVRLLEDYNGRFEQFSAGKEIVAGPDEIFAEKGTPVAERLEKLLKEF